MQNQPEQLTVDHSKLLAVFLLAEEPSQSEEALDTLFSSVVIPAVKNTLKHKMNVSLSTADTSARNLDALELVSDAEAELLRKFRSLRNLGKDEQITNPEGYSRAVATNMFRQYLRDKYPQRRRLRNKIRYIFNNKKGFALWKGVQGEYLCGTEEWRRENRPGIKLEPNVEPHILIAAPQSNLGDIDDNRRIFLVLKNLLKIAGGPIELNRTVRIVADVLGINDPIETEINPNSSADFRDLEDRLIDRWSLVEFWRSIVDMPLRHRTALLLNLRGEYGENALAFFPKLRIASMRDIAQVLEIAPEDLASIWNELPLDDNSIGERLGLTRQQIINLRQSARANLRRKRIE